MLAFRNRLDTLPLWGMLGYAALLIAWLVAQPIPPLQDYEDWIFQGWVGAHLLLAQPAVVAHYSVVHHPVPNAASQAVLTCLTALAGPLAGSKLFIASLLTGFVGACYAAYRKFHTGSPASSPGCLALVLFLIFAANSAFWDGYVNYQLSILVLFCYLLPNNRLSPVWTGCVALVLFSCHASTYFAFVLLTVAEVVFDKKRLSRLLALAPSLGLLVWYVLAKHDAVADQGAAGPLYSGLLHHLEYKFYTLTKMGPFHNLVDFTNASLKNRAHTFYLAGITLNIVFGIVLAAAILPSTWRILRRQPRNPWMSTSVALFLLFLILPGKTFGVVNLGERLLYPCFLIAIIHMRKLEFSRTLAALGTCGAVLTAAQFLSMPSAKATSPVSALESTLPANEQYYDKYGLYNSRLYAFDMYRVWMEKPDLNHLPVIGFDTSLFLDRKP